MNLSVTQGVSHSHEGVVYREMGFLSVSFSKTFTYILCLTPVYSPQHCCQMPLIR
jgi:hypothetical protein